MQPLFHDFLHTLLHTFTRAAHAALWLAVTCFPVAGLAQPELGFYGSVDVGVACTRVSGEGSGCGLLGGGQSDTLWGLQGTETLGDGYARFALEAGFDATDGRTEDPDRLFNRQAWVGLGHGDWGEVRLGRQTTVGEDFVTEVEVAGWRDFGMGALLRAADSHPVSNQLSWRSPQWRGVQVAASYSFDVRDADAAGPRVRSTSLAARFEDAPWLLAASVERMQRLNLPGLPGLPGLTGRRPLAWQLGASYDFGPARLALGWSRQRHGFVGRNGDDGPDALAARGLTGLGPLEFIDGGRLDAVYAGVALPAGPGEWQVQGSQGRPNWRWQESGRRARRSQFAAFGYVYPLSPRTNLYAFAAQGRRYAVDEAVRTDEPRARRLALGLTHRF